jgi:hypothetical protein
VTGTTRHTDVLIVGSGIMGSIVARLLRERDPAVRIAMVDGGSPIGAAPGVHLHDIDDPVLWSRYNDQVVTGIQGMYMGAEVVREVAASLGGLTPGMFHALAFGEDAEAMPAAALAWNAGGMGVHWTAATPSPGEDEAFDFGDPAAWAADLETARRVLSVEPSAIGPTQVGQVVLDVLRRRYRGVGPDHRRPQPMPMAVTATSVGPLPRTAPGPRGHRDAVFLRGGRAPTAAGRRHDNAVHPPRRDVPRRRRVRPGVGRPAAPAARAPVAVRGRLRRPRAVQP